jgi:EAL domain-containing protein (putative c-di-GMP-specific phosphodiesterase class I)
MEGAWGPANRRGESSVPGPGSGPPAWAVILALVALLAASTLVAVLVRGRLDIAPHVFYIPILLAAVRFGTRGAAVVALVSAAWGGPGVSLLAPGRASEPIEWAVHGAFFVLLGLTMAWVTARRKGAEAAADRSRQTISRLNERLRHQEREVASRREATERVQGMLKKESVRIVVQPIADLLTGKVVGLEALSRFQATPERTPDIWFAEAKDVGLGLELELKAVRSALGLVEAMPPDVYLAVNISPDTIASPRFVELMDGIPPERIVLEVTEHAPVEDYGVLARALEPFRARGCRLAVDDAGAGFASFRHILRLNPDIIKLDMTLVRNIDQDPARRALASGLISFASDLGAKIIAEGLETTTELGALRNLGVRLGQGYYLARPESLGLVDLSKVEKILRPMSLAGGGSAPLPGQERPADTPAQAPATPATSGQRLTIPEHRPEPSPGQQPPRRPKPVLQRGLRIPEHRPEREDPGRGRDATADAGGAVPARRQAPAQQ